MNKFLVLLCCSIASILCIEPIHAQYTYKIKADSIRLYNDNCNAELIIENGTRNVIGFLFNTGNGRTVFKTEEDPTIAAYIKSITAQQVTQWNTAYGWGDHHGLYQPLENQRLSTGNEVIFNSLTLLSGRLTLLNGNNNMIIDGSDPGTDLYNYVKFKSNTPKGAGLQLVPNNNNVPFPYAFDFNTYTDRDNSLKIIGDGTNHYHVISASGPAGVWPLAIQMSPQGAPGDRSQDVIRVKTDKGLQFPQLGAGYLMTDAAGNVSVNTNISVNPGGENLQSVTSRNATTSNVISTYGYAVSGGTPVNTGVWGSQGVSLAFNVNNAEVGRFMVGGNMGIGTTTPAEKLDVSGTVKAQRFYNAALSGIGSSRNSFQSLNDGTANSLTAGWIAGDFGGLNGGNRVVLGTGYQKALIGAHTSTLNSWADLYLKANGNEGQQELRIPITGDPTWNNSILWHAGNFTPASYVSKWQDWSGNFTLTGNQINYSSANAALYADAYNIGFFTDGGYVFANRANNATRMELTSAGDLLISKQVKTPSIAIGLGTGAAPGAMIIDSTQLGLLNGGGLGVLGAPADKYPLRLYESYGWNFTLQDMLNINGHSSGFRVKKVNATDDLSGTLFEVLSDGTTNIKGALNASNTITSSNSNSLSSTSYGNSSFSSLISGSNFDNGARPGYGFHVSGRFGTYLYAQSRSELHLKGDDNNDWTLFTTANFDPNNLLPKSGGTLTGLLTLPALNFTDHPGDPSPVITSRAVPASQGGTPEATELILFHSNDPYNASGPDYITLRSPAIRLQTFNDVTIDNIGKDAGSNDRLRIEPDGTVNISGATNVGGALSVGTTSSFFSNNVWAGVNGHFGYLYSGGNSRFGFSSPGGAVDVYSDGNFYATENNYRVWHSGDFDHRAKAFAGTNIPGAISPDNGVFWGLSNLDNLTFSFMGSVNNVANAPTGDAWHFVINPSHRNGIGDGNQWNMQIVSPLTNGSHEVYARWQNAGNWSGYQRFWTDYNFNPDTKANTSGQYSSLDVGHATNSEYINNEAQYMRFHWSGQAGQPTWLWGGNNAGNMYVYNPANFRVNYADTAGTANNVNATNFMMNGYHKWAVFQNNMEGTPPPVDHGLILGWNYTGGIQESYFIAAGISNGMKHVFATWNGQTLTNNVLFQTNGDVACRGIFASQWSGSYSDARFKENIADVSPLLEDIMKIRVVDYSYKNEKSNHATRKGVIAQEMEKIFPFLVKDIDNIDENLSLTPTSTTKYKAVDYGALSAILVKGMQEQQQTIQQLTKRIAELEKQQKK